MKALLSILIAAVLCPIFVTAQSETPTNEVINTILARRSVRKYLDKPVEHEKLEAVVNCGINAPNGMNKQPWEIRVVENQTLIKEVSDAFVKANPEMVKRDANFKNMFRNAPNIICIATLANGGGEIDAGLLGGNMVIAAQSLGLGTCCLGGPVRFLLDSDDATAKSFMEKLGFSADYKLNYIIAIGYPDETPAAKPRDTSKVKYVK